MSRSNSRKRAGFAVIELRVVITIIAVIAASLFMAGQEARAIDVGYNYTSDYKMKTVMLDKPLPGGQSMFELVVGGRKFPLQSGKRFWFTSEFPAGVDAFTIRGINASEQLDLKTNPRAFPTAISWVEQGVIPKVVMQPIQYRPSLLLSGWLWLGVLTALALGGAGLFWWWKKQAA